MIGEGDSRVAIIRRSYSGHHDLQSFGEFQGSHRVFSGSPLGNEHLELSFSFISVVNAIGRCMTKVVMEAGVNGTPKICAVT